MAQRQYRYAKRSHVIYKEIHVPVILNIIIIIINDIYRVQTSPRSKCAKSAVARLQLS